MVPVGQQLVEADQIFMGDIGERAKLALEPVEVSALGLAQHLEGHAGGPLSIEGFVDDPEPALAQLPSELETLGAGEGDR